MLDNIVSILITSLFSFSVWSFLPRSSIWKCSTHYLLWCLYHICLRLWVCQHCWIFQVRFFVENLWAWSKACYFLLILFSWHLWLDGTLWANEIYIVIGILYINTERYLVHCSFRLELWIKNIFHHLLQSWIEHLFNYRSC